MSFDKYKLPSTAYYFAQQLTKIQHSGNKITACCPFHPDKHPSLSVNLDTGSYKCFACGTHGRGIMSFHQRRYGLSFKDTARALGAWN